MRTARLSTLAAVSVGAVVLGVSPVRATLPQDAVQAKPASTQRQAQPSAIRPVAKAQQAKAGADKLRDSQERMGASLEDGVQKMGEAMGQALGKMISSMTQAIGGALAEWEAQAGPYPEKGGEGWITRGSVDWAHSQNGQSMVLFKRPGKDGWTDHFLFRGDHESLLQAKEGMSGRLAGRYSGKDVDEKNKVVNWILDDARFVSDEEWAALQGGNPVAGAPGSEAASASKRFAAATKGWAFKGTVDGEGGRPVAVFEKPAEGGKEVDFKLVRDGQWVEPGFRLVYAKSGYAEVVVDGKSLGVTPW